MYSLRVGPNDRAHAIQFLKTAAELGRMEAIKVDLYFLTLRRSPAEIFRLYGLPPSAPHQAPAQCPLFPVSGRPPASIGASSG